MTLWKTKLFVLGSVWMGGCADPLFLVGTGSEFEETGTEEVQGDGRTVVIEDEGVEPAPLDTALDSEKPTALDAAPTIDTLSPPTPDTTPMADTFSPPLADTAPAVDTFSPPDTTSSVETAPTCQAVNEGCACPYPGPCSTDGTSLWPSRCCSGVCRNRGAGTAFICN